MINCLAPVTLKMEERPFNLLLVDDDDIIVMNVKRAFEKLKIGDPVWVARDGVEAITLLRGDTYPAERRLLLLDLKMPRMNGIELLREIRHDPALHNLPVVVFSTSNEARDRTATWDLNIASFLVKPATFADFVDLMRVFAHYWHWVDFP